MFVGDRASYTRTLDESTMTTREQAFMSVEENAVIEVLKDFPDNVAAFACHGHVTKADYEAVVISDIEERLKRHKKMRLYTEIAPDFVGMDPGAVWPETKCGFSHLFDWERGAMVTDVGWVKQAVKFFSLFGFLMSGEGRVFSTAEADRAREWVVGGGPAARM